MKCKQIFQLRAGRKISAIVKSRVRVLEARHYGDNVVSFRFQVLNRPPRFKPGQFVHVAMDDYNPAQHWPDSRPFTIASGPANKKEISLVVANAGVFTNRMHETLAPGTEAWIKGPYGKFLIDCNPANESVLIAGGTGISPFSSYMEFIRESELDVDKVHLHYSAKSPKLMSCQELIEQTVSAKKGFRVTRYLTAASADAYVSRRPEINIICDALASPQTAVYYLCGPLQMVRSFTKVLLDDYSVPEVNIRFEEWS